MIKSSKSNLFVVFIYLFVFYPLLERISGAFSYWDEMFVVFFFGYVVIHNKTKISRDKAIIFMLLFTFVVLGIGSTLLYNYQPIKAVIEDIVINLKFFCALGFAYFYFDGEEVEKNSKFITRNIDIILIIYVLLICINRVLNIFPQVEGINKIFAGDMLFYEHPTYLAASVGFLVCVVVSLPMKYKMVRLAILAFVGMDTARSKMIAWVAIAALIYFWIIFLKKKIGFIQVVILGGFAIVVGMDKIIKYFVTYKDAGRGLLYSVSFQIMRDFFPFGAGYATYGSGASAKYYSPLYYLYGMDMVYGFYPEDVKFANDAFWPILFAQFGIISTLLYLIILVYLFSIMQKIFYCNKYMYCSAILAFVYLIISSTSETAFFNCLAIPFAFYFGYLLKKCE